MDHYSLAIARGGEEKMMIFKNLPIDGVFVSFMDVRNLATHNMIAATRVVISGGGGGGSNIGVVHMAHL